jgi:hypothetical protein
MYVPVNITASVLNHDSAYADSVHACAGNLGQACLPADFGEFRTVSWRTRRAESAAVVVCLSGMAVLFQIVLYDVTAARDIGGRSALIISGAVYA